MHAPLKSIETSAQTGAPADASARNAPIGAVRAFLTLLVVAHHAMLTYHPYAPAPKAFAAPPILWTAFPVVDPQRFGGFSLLTLVNDLFFMSLMFLVSGLFVAGGLRAKGAGGFLKGRALRLGVPFVVGAGLLAPLAYYPAWLQSGGAPSLAAYAKAWTHLPFWPSGPAWFLWVLLAFAAVAATLDRLFPALIPALGRWTQGAARRPGRAFLVLLAASALAYVPLNMALPFGHWTMVGPFLVQTGRIGHYLVYFLAGLAFGAAGVGQGLTDPHGALARRWWAWQIPPAPAVVAAVAIFILAFSPNPPPKSVLDVAGGLAFVIACASLSFAVLAVFLRFIRKTGPIGASLQANAYGIYLTHYVFTAWLSWLLLPQAWGGLAKGLVVIGGAVALSWLTTTALRRTPLLGRIL
ncbi:acyltransferase [Caulobacter sp. BE254]|uniref:acyltransferase family protein n=1 Tax=Caulobacter sp. BE254 TaxID=2817720 RepID=UPI0028663D26|nr:acyltransferase [Caulobacter sp. BE254]MDR7116915.1 peptidoglycan/LPS O-acetylase OafA/YrhL [Caulobacter sp. BE254]